MWTLEVKLAHLFLNIILLRSQSLVCESMWRWLSHRALGVVAVKNVILIWLKQHFRLFLAFSIFCYKA